MENQTIILTHLPSQETVQEEPKEIKVSEKELWTVILAACTGTLIEWYSFFVFGSAGIASLFFKTGTPAGDNIAWLSSYAVGFIFRPIGALIFGAIGDRFGRKVTFLTTVIMMGAASTLVGCLPTMAQIGGNNAGAIAGSLLIFLRIIEGLAIGKSVYDSPIYRAVQEKHAISKNPLFDTFVVPANLKIVVLAFFGATMGQGALWYTAQFYFQTFLVDTLLIDYKTAYGCMCIALLFASPFFVLFGHLSDRFGRKPFIVSGLVLGAALLYPLYLGVAAFAPFQMAGNAVSKGHYNGNASNVMITFLLFVAVLLVYGPIASFLCELFPTRLRYTSMSFPYHVGNGVIGGLVPVLGLTATTVWVPDNIFAGLYFPLSCISLCAVVAFFFIPETCGVALDAHDDEMTEDMKKHSI